MTPDDVTIINGLDRLVFRGDILPEIERVSNKLKEQLHVKPTAAFVREDLPLTLFGAALPQEVQSSNVYVIRPLVSSGLERHPNSHQRSVSLIGDGIFELNEEERYALVASAATPAGRWVSIPPNTWHQAIAGRQAWTVVTFHTMPDMDIINERK